MIFQQMKEIGCDIGINILKKINIKILLLMLACDDNTFGVKCANNCNCNAANSGSPPCNKENGTCNCKPGYDPHLNCVKGK